MARIRRRVVGRLKHGRFGNRYLRAIDPFINAADRLRMRTTTPAAALPTTRCGAHRARSIPQLFWPDWTSRLLPVTGGFRFDRFRGTLAVLLTVPGDGGSVEPWSRVGARGKRHLSEKPTDTTAKELRQSARSEDDQGTPTTRTCTDRHHRCRSVRCGRSRMRAGQLFPRHADDVDTDGRPHSADGTRASGGREP